MGAEQHIRDQLSHIEVGQVLTVEYTLEKRGRPRFKKGFRGRVQSISYSEGLPDHVHFDGGTFIYRMGQQSRFLIASGHEGWDAVVQAIVL